MIYKLTTDEQRQMVVDNLGLVRAIARRICHRSSGLDDMISIGNIALMKAAVTYDPENAGGVPFSGYAARCIENEILMEIRRSKQDAFTVSLDCDRDNEDGGSYRLEMFLAANTPPVESRMEEQCVRGVLWDAISELPGQQREVVEKRFFGGLNQVSVAAAIGHSQSTVNRREKQALQMLRTLLEERL